MKLETFFEKFELFADAPDAVAKMRKLVLELAVQGRLVGQVPADEPTDILAASIAQDRAIFVKDRGLTRQRVLAPVGNGECPFALPSGWQWTRLGNLCRVQAGFAFQSAGFVQGDTGMPLIRIRDITKDRTQVNYVGEYREEFLVEPGDYLVGMDGNFTVTKWRGPRALLNQRVSRLQWYSRRLEPSFFAVALQHRLSELQGTKAYTTVDHLSSGQIEDAVVPLPPLAEQKRIVAKVDELMALCDRLEAQQQERETRHAALARASLARFAEAPTPANLEWIFHPSYTIPPADLRKAILTLAVQGKLVARIGSEGTGTEILERAGILIEQIDDVPEVPPHWVWSRLGNVATRMDSGWSPACIPEPAEKGQWGVLKTTAVQILQYQEQQNKTLPPNLEPRPEHEVMDGDVLFTRAGPMNRVGILCVARPTRNKLMISDKIIRFHLVAGIDPDFAALSFSAGYPSEVIEKLKSGMAASQVNISQPKLKLVPIPIPPLAEQRRIVAKVEQLMALVDELEQQLAASRATAEKLLTALVAGITSEPSPVGSNGTHTARGLGEESLEEEYALCPC